MIAALLTIAVLASISVGVLRNVTAKHQNSYQAAAWRDALVAAESGVERAMSELRNTIDDPTNAWTGWVVVDAAGKPTGQKVDRDGNWATGYAVRLTESLPAQSGERSEPRYSVVIDVPSTLAATAKRWNQSYRIRSTGLAVLPGTARAPSDKRDAQLRRLSIIWDRTTGFATSGARLATPQATRTIEIIAKPQSVYSYGLTAEIVFKLNKKTFVDGYNSNYEEWSTNGRYDPSKRTPDGGSILANRWKKKPKPDKAEEKFDVGHATVYGDLLVKGTLKNVKNFENVQGDKITNVSLQTPTNLAPQWTSVTANISTLDGKVPKELAATYKVDEKQAKAGGPVAQFEAKSATAAAEVAAKGMELHGRVAALQIRRASSSGRSGSIRKTSR